MFQVVKTLQGCVMGDLENANFSPAKNSAGLVLRGLAQEHIHGCSKFINCSLIFVRVSDTAILG